MSKAQPPKEALESIKNELTELSVQADLIRQQMEFISNVIAEYSLSKNAIEELKKRGGKGEALIPVGAGNFINAELKGVKTIVVSVGSGVFLEKSIDAVISDLEERIRKAQGQITGLQNQFLQVSARIQQLQGAGNQLYEQLEASGQA